MSTQVQTECTTTEEEDSPTVDPQRIINKVPEYSPISYMDSDFAVHCKIAYASRKLWLLMGQWQQIFPPTQWRDRAQSVLCDSGTLRHIIPFAMRINSLDGKVWAEQCGGTARVVYRDPGPLW